MRTKQNVHNEDMQVTFTLQGSCGSLTSAVLGMHCVTVVTRGADFTVWSGRVVHAAQALACQRVAVSE